MAYPKDFELLSGERVEVALKPHPLSFLRYYLACVYLALLAAALYALQEWLHHNVWANPWISGILKLIFGMIPGLSPEELVSLIIFWLVLVLSGLLMGILWVSKMPLVYMILIGVAGTLLEAYIYPSPLTKPALLLFSAIIGLILVDAYRRGHKFYLTNYRIITVKRFIGREVREIMYDKISDVYVHQGLLGRLFNYGTVIPVSESGFGLGEDAALAALGVGSVGKGISAGVIVGGKRGASRPRAATYFSLYGVPNPRRIRGIIGGKMLEMKEAPILRRIEDLLREGKEGDRKDRA